MRYAWGFSAFSGSKAALIFGSCSKEKGLAESKLLINQALNIVKTTGSPVVLSFKTGNTPHPKLFIFSQAVFCLPPALYLAHWTQPNAAVAVNCGQVYSGDRTD